MCIGAQKAATTWLYDALSRVPGVFLPRIKELHYFSELYAPDARRFGPRHRTEQIKHVRAYHLARNSETAYGRMVLEQMAHVETGPISDDWYRGIFSFAHDNEVCGEICPCYMSLPPRGIRHALSINPLMRILLIVRDPIDRAWSHMRMHVKGGHLDADLGKVIRGETSLGPYLLYTDYANAIRRWQSMAGEGRFKVILYDQIGEDPHAVLDEILDYIGMSGASTKADLSRSVFSGDPLDMPIELRAMLLGHLKSQYDYLNRLFPQQVERWRLHHITALDHAGTPRV
ncbi:MAG: sulfotransferase [Phycisphaerales bacterium]